MQIYSLCDSSTLYFIHGVLHVGERPSQTNEPSQGPSSSASSTSPSSYNTRTDISVPNKTVLKFTQMFQNQDIRRIIICDNYFCSNEGNGMHFGRQPEETP